MTPLVKDAVPHYMTVHICWVYTRMHAHTLPEVKPEPLAPSPHYGYIMYNLTFMIVHVWMCFNVISGYEYVNYGVNLNI